jgi:NAD(P)H-dependent FMN reductase
MKLGIISGSHRLNSQSEKVSRHIEKTLLQEGSCDEVYLLSLGGNPLPLWDESIWEGNEEWQQRMAPISSELASCDGFIIVAPEWHGMAPAALKNFFLIWTGGGELAHKPALIVTVSVADGGSFPVAELRMSSYKNNRICFIPEHLIIRYVDTVFNVNSADNKDSAQEYFQQRLEYCLQLLRQYALAMVNVRASGAASLETYSSGM